MAAPIIILISFFVIIGLTIRAIPYVGWLLVGLVVLTAIAACAGRLGRGPRRPRPGPLVQAGADPAGDRHAA